MGVVTHLGGGGGDAEFAGVDDGADGVDGGAVVGLLVLAVLDEAPVDDVGLEVAARDEVVVLAVDLVVLLRPARVCRRKFCSKTAKSLLAGLDNDKLR